MREAIGPNYFLDLSKSVSGHCREQVVLDLAAQPARAVIDSHLLLDVPTREDLLTQEVCRRGAF